MSALRPDFSDPNKTLVHGLFCEEATFADTKRTFLTYIPERLAYCSPCLVVAPPSTAVFPDYLEEAGLLSFADRHHLYLHVLVPEEGRWQLDGTDADFMNEVYKAIQGRNYYVTMQDNIYACGIGEGATIAHQATQRMASEWSGLFSCGDLQCLLGETQGKRAKTYEQDNTELKIAAERCQLPVWMAVSSLDGFNEEAIRYWKEENHVMGSPLCGCGADYIWMPSPVTPKSEINEEVIAQVRVKIGDTQPSDALLDTMWAYLSLARRHRGYGHKNLRYFRSPEVFGAEKRELISEGMTRLWYEYVPEGCTPDGQWPLVVVMHGRGGTADTFFDISLMAQVAEERKFITVFPQAGIHQQKPGGLRNVLYWNGSFEEEPIDDVAFIRGMIQDIQNRMSIDSGRIYACGQSSGGIMADVLSKCAGDLFTACASWSGMYHPKKVHKAYERLDRQIPTMFICGDSDPFCTEKGEDPEYPFHLNPELRKDIEEKIALCGLDKNRLQTWVTEPITWYCYPDKDNVPILTVGIVKNMAHANYPEESWITYDQFFSQFSRDGAGRLCYRGQLIQSLH